MTCALKDRLIADMPVASDGPPNIGMDALWRSRPKPLPLMPSPALGLSRPRNRCAAAHSKGSTAWGSWMI
jgi:hypothetical protein